MSNALGRFALLFILAVLVLAAFNAVTAMLIVPQEQTGRFDGQWQLAYLVTETIRALPALQATVVLLVFSLFVSQGSLAKGGKGTFTNTIKLLLPVFLVMTAGFTLLQEFVLPAQWNLREHAVQAGVMSRDLLRSARNAQTDRDWNLARYYYTAYLTLLPEDEVVRRSFDEVMTQIHTAEQATPRQPAADEPGTLSGLDYRGALERSLTYLRAGDYVTAEYYASLAASLDPQNPEPKLLLETIRSSRPPLSEGDQERAAFFAKKREAADLLGRADRGENVREYYQKAYYLLVDLAEKRPTDPEVREFLLKAEQGMRKNSFFLEEIPLLSDLFGSRDLLLRNREAEKVAPGLVHYILIRRLTMVMNPDRTPAMGDRGHLPDGSGIGTYCFGVNLFGLDPKGALAYQAYAPFGKVVGKDLVLFCSQRENTARYYSLTVTKGTLPFRFPHLYPLPVEDETLASLSLADQTMEWAPIARLFGLRDVFREAGLATNRIEKSIALRFLHPASFLMLSFLALMLAWRFKAFYLTKPPLLVYLMTPFVFAGVSLLAGLYLVLWDSVLVIVFKSLSFEMALIPVLAVKGLLLTAILLLLAAQKD